MIAADPNKRSDLTWGPRALIPLRLGPKDSKVGGQPTREEEEKEEEKEMKHVVMVWHYHSYLPAATSASTNCSCCPTLIGLPLSLLPWLRIAVNISSAKGSYITPTTT